VISTNHDESMLNSSTIVDLIESSLGVRYGDQGTTAIPFLVIDLSERSIFKINIPNGVG